MDSPLYLSLPSTDVYTLEAYDFRGNLLDTDTININTTYDVPSLVDALRITELMYNPHDAPANSPYDNDDFEFVELTNVAGESIDLQGAQFVRGFDFTFGDVQLAPGELIVVVKNDDAFESRYGSQVNIAGEFVAGGLSNGGESIELVDALGNTILLFSYQDSGDWPERADGGASSLVVIDPHGDLSDAGNWRASSDYGGSPGTAGSGPSENVVVNEVLSHTDLPQHDSIELFNSSDQEIDIGGWYSQRCRVQLLEISNPHGTLVSASGNIWCWTRPISIQTHRIQAPTISPWMERTEMMSG